MSFAGTVKRSWNGNQLMSAMLELTYACNLDCTFCYNDLALEGEKLSLAQYRGLLDDLADIGALTVILTGGEPLAHPDFYAIGAHARARGFVVRIKSNGHALNEATARRIRQEIDPFIIEVSLHGAASETHDRQTRVRGSFDRLVRNVASMRELGLRVKVNSVLTSWNENEVDAMFALCDELDVPLQIDTDVKPRDDGDRSPINIAASASGIAAYNRTVAARYEKAAQERVAPSDAAPARGRITAAERKPAEETDKNCGAGSNSIAVDPHGNVLPCVQWRAPVGNLHSKSLREIWAGSSVLDEVRQTTKDAKSMIAALGEDGLSANFCPGSAHLHSGNPLSLYPAAEARIQSARARVRLPLL